MNKIMLILVFLFTFIPISFAQNAGHPGGGGPDIITNERDPICAGLAGESVELEKKFLKSWNQEYESSNNFYKVMNQIILENVIHTIGDIEQFTNKQTKNCKNDQNHFAEINLSNRPHLKEELNLLKQIENKWKEGIKNISGSKKCSEYFSSRYNHFQELEALIKLYEKSES